MVVKTDTTECDDPSDADGSSICYKIRTLQDAAAVAGGLAQHFDEPEVASMAISELLLNAIEHGNLGVGGELKARLLSQGTYFEEVERRLSTAPWKSRIASVELAFRDPGWIVTITDEGEGFDWKNLPTELDFSRLNGRGLLMARELFFDDVSFKKKGSVCVAVKNKPARLPL